MFYTLTAFSSGVDQFQVHSIGYRADKENAYDSKTSAY